MKIIAIDLTNIRGFQKLPKTELSRSINVFVGANNAGKSTILSCIQMLQSDVLKKSDITIGENNGVILLFYEGEHHPYIKQRPNSNCLQLLLNEGHRNYTTDGKGNLGSFPSIQNLEPNNLIYPYLSKRKTVEYTDEINESNTNSVNGNFQNLYSKIDRLITPQFQPANSQYVEACTNILGYVISTLARGKGKRAVYYVYNQEHIPLTAMGEGVSNILGLIVDLCVAENKIFLIEEPENDIHPKALKSLLNLIIEKSKTNQFFVSTHSNIVMKYLGGADEAKVFKVSNNMQAVNRPKLNLATIEEIPKNPEIRRQVLEDLGYEFYDFDLWEAWLLLEESTAERIIREFLIPWFFPKLQNRLRTFSANGIDSVVPKFEDFNRLFTFLHLSPTYKNKVWVMVDHGEREQKIIDKLKSVYLTSGWSKDNFISFKKHDFEEYYPSKFAKDVKSTLIIKDRQLKKEAKKLLFEKVYLWCSENPKEAKEALKKSAAEIISYLKIINTKLIKPKVN